MHHPVELGGSVHDVGDNEGKSSANVTKRWLDAAFGNVFPPSRKRLRGGFEEVLDHVGRIVVIQSSRIAIHRRLTVLKGTALSCCPGIPLIEKSGSAMSEKIPDRALRSCPLVGDGLLLGTVQLRTCEIG